MKRAQNVLLILAVFMGSVFIDARALETGNNAKDFTLQDVNGKAVTLSDFKGKVIILDFFATWCPPCKKEIPDFIALEKAYGTQGFAMVGVAIAERADAKSFADKIGINYTVLVDDGKASAEYGPIRAIPQTFVIDKNFKIARAYIGYKSKEVFEADIKALCK